MKSYAPALFAAGLFAQHAAAHSTFQQAGSGSTDFDTKCTRLPVSAALLSLSINQTLQQH